MTTTSERWMTAAAALALGLAAAEPAPGARAVLETRVADPYLGAIVIDADSGQILGADRPDAPAYPASVLKLMVLAIILEKADAGALRLDDPVTVTAESSRIGGSQVYLKEHEVFTVDELLYALMVQSANDAAVALALHAAGSQAAFVALMNERARMLGLRATVFHSVHGLPPSEGQQPDQSTPRDLATLARYALRFPDTLRYTGTRERGFRDNTFIMRTHNRLMASFAGCDGLKTGYFKHAGYSMVTTARRGADRVIAVVVGSPSRATRDQAAAEWMTRGFQAMPPKEPAPAPAPVPPPAPPQEQPPQPCCGLRGAWPGISLAAVALLAAGAWYWRRHRAGARAPAPGA